MLRVLNATQDPHTIIEGAIHSQHKNRASATDISGRDRNATGALRSLALRKSHNAHVHVQRLAQPTGAVLTRL